MKYTPPGFCVTRSTSAFASASFSARFPGLVLGWENLFIPRHFQRLITGKLIGVDPGRPQHLQRRKVDRNNPIKPLTVSRNESKKNSENNTQIIMAACTWPSNSNLSRTLKKAKCFKTNAIAIKIKCSNNFPWGIVLKLPTQAWNIKRKFHHVYCWKRLFPSAKITLQMTHSDWSNLVTHTTCSTLNKNLHSKSTYFLKLTHQESWRSNGFLKGQSQLMHMPIRYHFLADLHVTESARET